MIAKVFHAKHMIVALSDDAVIAAAKERGLQGYVHVACVEIPDTSRTPLEFVFEKTNTIDCDWTLNPEVVSMAGRGRSTSMGDLVEIDGKVYVCLAVGWVEIDISTEPSAHDVS